jgi:hypothetical protein
MSSYLVATGDYDLFLVFYLGRSFLSLSSLLALFTSITLILQTTRTTYTITIQYIALAPTKHLGNAGLSIAPRYLPSKQNVSTSVTWSKIVQDFEGW